MPAKRRTNIGKPIRSISLVKFGNREKLGDLEGSTYGSARDYHDLQRDLRDGASEQRCGGGVRIIRKKTPE